MRKRTLCLPVEKFLGIEALIGKKVSHPADALDLLLKGLLK